jgi:hypothetical protein
MRCGRRPAHLTASASTRWSPAAAAAHTIWHMQPTMAATLELSAPPLSGSRKPAAPDLQAGVCVVVMVVVCVCGGGGWGGRGRQLRGWPLCADGCRVGSEMAAQKDGSYLVQEVCSGSAALQAGGLARLGGGGSRALAMLRHPHVIHILYPPPPPPPFLPRFRHQHQPGRTCASSPTASRRGPVQSPPQAGGRRAHEAVWAGRMRPAGSTSWETGGVRGERELAGWRWWLRGWVGGWMAGWTCFGGRQPDAMRCGHALTRKRLPPIEQPCFGVAPVSAALTRHSAAGRQLPPT